MIARSQAVVTIFFPARVCFRQGQRTMGEMSPAAAGIPYKFYAGWREKSCKIVKFIVNYTSYTSKRRENISPSTADSPAEMIKEVKK